MVLVGFSSFFSWFAQSYNNAGYQLQKQTSQVGETKSDLGADLYGIYTQKNILRGHPKELPTSTMYGASKADFRLIRNLPGFPLRGVC